MRNKRLMITAPGQAPVRELLPLDYYDHLVEEAADRVVVVIRVWVNERRGNGRVLSPAGPRRFKTVTFAPGTVVTLEGLN